MWGETGLIRGGAVQDTGPSEHWTLGNGGAGGGAGGGGAAWFPGVLMTGGRTELKGRRQGGQ